MSATLSAAAFALEYNLLPAPGAPPSIPVPTTATYRTGPKDRWDTVAWRMYGDPTLISILVDANPLLPLACIFPPGTLITGPIIQPPNPPASTTPWQP